LENSRRISSSTFSYLFENRETVMNQINEMIYIESIEDESEIEDLINIYSEQLPDERTLSVTMFIEITDEKVLKESMQKLSGIENTIYLIYDNNEIKAIPEAGRSTGNLESTLQYLKFRFSGSDLQKFRNSTNAFIECRKQGYQEVARIPRELLGNLKSELSA
jgi:hypothetical protein